MMSTRKAAIGAAAPQPEPTGQTAKGKQRNSERSSVSTCASSGSSSQSDAPQACEKCKGRSPVCFRCRGEVWQACGRCSGKGEVTSSLQCWCIGRGAKGSQDDRRSKGNAPQERGLNAAPQRDCRKCAGTGVITRVRQCNQCSGEGLFQCRHCEGRGLFPCGTCGRGQVAGGLRPGRSGRPAADSLGPVPEVGVTIKRCTGTEFDQVAKLWRERGGRLEVLAAWAIDNPHRTWNYRSRRADLQKQLGRPLAELRGFHGSHPANILSISEKGFDAGRRAGQVFGSGEYFAKDPTISTCYCKGGSFMLICQLCLGHESSSQENLDGDHIWVPGQGYYVISEPAQALPLYIVQFKEEYRVESVKEAQAELAAALAQPSYRSGSATDGRLITLEFKDVGLSVEALPAQWWNGDTTNFLRPLCFQPANTNEGTAADGQSAQEGKVLLVWRGGGKFAATVGRAQQAGAQALLVVQNSGDPPITMTGCPSADESFPAAMISRADGERLIKLYNKSEVQAASVRRHAADSGVPPNRPCAMTAESSDSLWMGYLHAHFSDQQLAGDVRRFLERQAPLAQHAEIRIVRGKFTQAKVALGSRMSRDDVVALNTKPFIECGTERTLTVDDAHGSQGQRCPRSIAGYCRSRNLRFVDPCWCDHGALPTRDASYRLDNVPLDSAKGDEIRTAFLESAPFHSGMPQVLAVRAICNRQLQRQHEFYRRYLTQKNGEAPRQVELYHGTNVNILDTVYSHGLFPPSDMEAAEECPVSGGKGLRTSLCDNTCEFCTQPHSWDRCHMFGLGVYLGDMAQKSHRYVSGVGGDGVHKMLLCSVLLGDALKVEGHLKSGHAMHDVHSLRALASQDLSRMVESTREAGDRRPADQKDILFVKGLGGCCRPGFSVFNSEYISFHPYQCLPLYEITYTV